MESRIWTIGKQTGLSSRPWAEGHVCRACQRVLQRRRYAVATAAVAPPSITDDEPSAVLQSSATQPSFRVKAGILLSRAPLLTRDLTSFEKAFYFYQRRLNERLALPFTRYFYFKKGTPADLEWKRKMKDRSTAARDIGLYNAYRDEKWNDELLVGAKESEIEHVVNALITDAESTGSTDEQVGERKKDQVDRPQPRQTDADRRGDLSSLNRRLDRTLYLLGEQPHGRWSLPSSDLRPRENLHQAAERLLVHSGGINMNTWVVGRVPVGHCTYHHFPPDSGPQNPSEPTSSDITFFMKVRIMAGQPDLAANRLGLLGYRWLCKEEIQRHVNPWYWSNIKNMLADR